ncbi:penicillin acylase family protein, partial [Roseomonas sp. NAR14]
GATRPPGVASRLGRQGALLLALSALLPGCAALAPRPVTVAQRIAALPAEGLPLDAPVTLRWNDHLVPWIEAGTDRDLAFALGLVHYHLRGTQIAVMRAVARGRLAEIAGPLATDIDHALRILDFGHAAPEVERRFPPETRAFVERFVAGLNWAQAHTRRPPESGLLGLPREPYTVADMLAVGRLAGSDVDWFSYFTLLPGRGGPGYAQRFRRMREAGGSLATTQTRADATALATLLAGLSRSGSNSVAVAPAHSASGAAMLASDPHLSLNLPNLWLLVGMRSPSYHAVGLMVPGLPFLGLGRNPGLAWGGTNMRAASSDLFDVSALPPGEIREERTRIRRRLWFPAARTLRRTAYGPVMTDAAVVPHRPGDAIALRWIGHEPTDEITALLRAARARDGAEFRAAFAGFGVSAQNMLYADRAGGIGHVLATTLPDRPGLPETDPVLPATAANLAPWQRLIDARSLPALIDPPEGLLASANNRPPAAMAGGPPIGIFFSDDDRVERLRALLRARPRLTPADLTALQTDTTSPRAAGLAAGLLARLDALPGGAPDPALLAPLRGWDGDYAPDSRAALLFELLLRGVVRGVANAGAQGNSGDGLAGGRGPETQWAYITTFLLRDLDALPAEARATLLREAVAGMAEDAARWADWGTVHRLRVAHWLVNLPVLGRRFVQDSFPVGGSRETPMKTGHGLVQGPHEVSFGSMARHVSDLADPDANWFTLFGGQDGWLGSDAFADQVPLWRARRGIRMPLRPETVAAEFPHVTTLRPAP